MQGELPTENIKERNAGTEVKPAQEFKLGALQAVPIMMGYFALSVAYGVLARDAGLSILETVAMSVLVYAGAAQFIAVGMFAAAMSPWAIIATTFLVNLRHLLMSTSLAPYFQRLRLSTLALLGTGITDETFALNSAELAKKRYHYFFTYGTNLASYSAWCTGSLVGAVCGSAIPGLDKLPLDFALPAMFISLLVMQLTDRLLIITAVLAGTLSLLFAMLLEGNWNIILATVLAATIAAGWEKWRKNSG
ncbi:MAG: AzlC family ABC transporter permease [Peptococcaceae bacterium]|nr:AzlC family ABC transporter permease [Peptococcaceae bacterium]